MELQGKKYFVTSDIHSFYTEFKLALDDAGFDIKNKNHILIVCGDLFDRGGETLETYKFIKSIPKSRRILIRGNHEYLLRDLVYKDYKEIYSAPHHLSNGTVKTVCQLAGYDQGTIEYIDYEFRAFIYGLDISTNALNLWYKAIDKVKKSKILDWIFGDEWVDYYEVDNFIFTHAFIPLLIPGWEHMYTCPENLLEYMPNWRIKANAFDLEQSTWGCPWKLYQAGLFDKEKKNGKILVCGHWHAYDAKINLAHKRFSKPHFDFSIFFSNNLVMLDACTAFSKQVNILVIEDGICYDKYHNKLITEIPEEQK